jgi:hypothetical protein
MQLDMVVAANAAAVKVFTSCGFNIMCTLPQVFQHPEAGLVDAHVMYCNFNTAEAKHPTDRGLAYSPVEATFNYPTANLTYTVGDEVQMLPSAGVESSTNVELNGLFGRFKVEPPLPEGLFLDPDTGAIRGTPARPCPEVTYRITACAAGEVSFQVAGANKRSSIEGFLCINEDFAAQLDDIVDLADMPSEPAKTRAFGDWMIWMVHRAWLNDPTLIDLNFDSRHMPEPHLEKRIAPKLMAAMLTNTHLEVLSLSNSNVQKSSALELAEALRQNCTLRTINLEANCLDSNCIRELALSIRDNSGATIEHLRLQHQRQMGPVFGRPAEEAVGQMMQRNEIIVKLGFECADGHWRNLIDRALVRNNDFSRRRQQNANGGIEEEDGPAEEKTLGHILLQASPAVASTDYFVESSARHGMLRAYMAQNLQLPTTSQLQHYAKNCGTPMPYTTAAPLIRECRSWLLDRALASEVSISDAFDLSTPGRLKAWQEIGGHWSIELSAEVGRLTFKSSREPALFLSPCWAQWLNRTKPSLAGA